MPIKEDLPQRQWQIFHALAMRTAWLVAKRLGVRPALWRFCMNDSLYRAVVITITCSQPLLSVLPPSPG
jgi:hypothetical protein